MAPKGPRWPVTAVTHQDISRYLKRHPAMQLRSMFFWEILSTGEFLPKVPDRKSVASDYSLPPEVALVHQAAGMNGASRASHPNETQICESFNRNTHTWHLVYLKLYIYIYTWIHRYIYISTSFSLSLSIYFPLYIIYIYLLIFIDICIQDYLHMWLKMYINILGTHTYIYCIYCNMMQM